MRHTQPDALTVVVSGFPDLQEAMAAILLQADEILTKPLEFQETSRIDSETYRRSSPACGTDEGQRGDDFEARFCADH